MFHLLIALLLTTSPTCPSECVREYCELRCKSATGPQSRHDCMQACWTYVNEHGCWPCAKPEPKKEPK